MFKRNLGLLALLFLLLLISACGKTPAPVADRTVLEVNGQAISESQYNKMLKFRTVLYEAQNQVKVDLNQDPDIAKQLQDAVYEQLVTDILIAQEAQHRGIAVSEDETENDLAQMKSAMGPGSYGDMLMRTGLVESDIRSMVKNELLVDKIYAAVGQANDQEVSDFYKQHQSELKQGLEISHILVKDEAQARQILDRAKQGEDFASLARQYSLDPGTKDDGGFLEAANLLTNWVPEFKEAALNMKPGELRGQPLKSPYGYHVMKAGKKVALQDTSFSDLQEVIREHLQNQKIAKVLGDLRQSAVINDLRVMR